MIMNRNMTFDDLFRDLAKFSIGFEPLFNRFEFFRSDLSNYPPYNLEKIDENNSRLTLAVAGFSKDDIEISLLDKVLTITGDNGPKPVDSNNKEVQSYTEKQYLYKGIASRQFHKQFIIGDNTVVTTCNLKDGLLIVNFLTSKPELNPIKPTILRIDSN